MFSPLKRKVKVCVLLDEEKALVMKSITFLKNFSLLSLGHFFHDFFNSHIFDMPGNILLDSQLGL